MARVTDITIGDCIQVGTRAILTGDKEVRDEMAHFIMMIVPDGVDAGAYHNVSIFSKNGGRA